MALSGARKAEELLADGKRRKNHRASIERDGFFTSGLGRFVGRWLSLSLLHPRIICIINASPTRWICGRVHFSVPSFSSPRPRPTHPVVRVRGSGLPSYARSILRRASRETATHAASMKQRIREFADWETPATRARSYRGSHLAPSFQTRAFLRANVSGHAQIGIVLFAIARNMYLENKSTFVSHSVSGARTRRHAVILKRCVSHAIFFLHTCRTA